MPNPGLDGIESWAHSQSLVIWVKLLTSLQFKIHSNTDVCILLMFPGFGSKLICGQSNCRQFHHPNKSWSQNQSWGWGPSHPANEFWHWHKGGRCRPVFTLIMKQHPNTWFYSISSILVSICLLLNLPKAVWLNLQSPGHSSVVKASILTDFCPALLPYS